MRNDVSTMRRNRCSSGENKGVGRAGRAVGEEGQGVAGNALGRSRRIVNLQGLVVARTFHVFGNKELRTGADRGSRCRHRNGSLHAGRMRITLILVYARSCKDILVRPAASRSGPIAKTGRVAREGAHRAIDIMCAIDLSPGYRVPLNHRQTRGRKAHVDDRDRMVCGEGQG